MTARVYSVDSIHLNTTISGDDEPPALTVSAVGQVPSSGWSNGRLSPWVYVVPPADGILDMDFHADPPAIGTIVLPAFRPIAAGLVLAIPDWVKGVRVHASQNSMEQMIGAQAGAFARPAAGDGMPLPWPFPWFRPDAKPDR